jgi:DNA replication protein
MGDPKGSMKGFAGFPAGKQPNTPLPDLFFAELLPAIDHLGELKVTLHIFWLLSRQKGERPFVSGEALSSDPLLLESLASTGLPPQEALADALERAEARGTLLRAAAGAGADRREWYFVNTEKGRQAIHDLLAGRWAPPDLEQPVPIEVQRPNIFVLYEQNIGPLTPLLVEELMEAEERYPASWIEDAFRESVSLNKRSWRYVLRILERWAAEGKTDETSRRVDEDDWRRFL